MQLARFLDLPHAERLEFCLSAMGAESTVMVKWGFIRPYGPPEAALYFLTSWKIASDGLGQMKGSKRRKRA
ncbi:hypothetical protein CO650_26435 [Rhizobium phaseoli]|nr:hypothetical protein CO650_26435 [Rhizobium phaseoli]PWI50670.1 hypothetical protein B5K03_29640 [Rhizobium phaseoli]